MARKVVHISLEEKTYFKLQQRAEQEHLRLSTWLKQKILELYKATEKERG